MQNTYIWYGEKYTLSLIAIYGWPHKYRGPSVISWRLWESKTHFHCVDLPMRDSLDPQSLCSLSPVQLPSSRFPVFWHTLLKWLPFLWFTSANVLWCFTAVKSPSFIVILLSYLYVRCLDWFSTFSIYRKMYKMIQFLTTCIYMN